MTLLRCDGLTVLAALSLLLTPLTLGAAAPQRTQTFDLRPLLSRGSPPAPGVTMNLHVSTAAIDRLEPNRWNVDLDGDSEWTAEDTVEAIEATLAQLEGAGSAQVTSDGRWLSVTGSEASLTAASQIVERIERLLLDSFEVELFEIPRTSIPGSTSPHPTAEETAKLIDEGPAIAFARVATPLGRTTCLDETTVHSFVYSYAVEVARGAIAADPVISVLRKGVEIGLRLDRAADGRSYIVRVWGRHGEDAAPMRRVPIPVLSGAEVELPSVRTTVWASSARLESGDSMLLDPGGDSLLLVRLAPDSQRTG
ncbi:MAG: hypothetical protein AAGG01_06135, partial [Planctomycetota bacterium]